MKSGGNKALRENRPKFLLHHLQSTGPKEAFLSPFCLNPASQVLPLVCFLDKNPTKLTRTPLFLV